MGMKRTSEEKKGQKDTVYHHNVSGVGGKGKTSHFMVGTTGRAPEGKRGLGEG